MDYVWLALIGLVAGFAGGLLGIGGSIIMIPAMNELFGLHQHLHQAAAMIVNFFVVTPAVRQHARARAIVWPLVRRVAPVAVVAVLVGVAVSESQLFSDRGQAYLSLLFGCFMACIAATDLYRMLYVDGPGRCGAGQEDAAASSAAAPSQPIAGWFAALSVGVPTGFIAGLLGVGGGIIMVPLQRRILKLPLRTAIANSAATIIALSLVGATMKNYEVIADNLAPWWRTFTLAAVLIPTAVIGANAGAKLTHILPLGKIRIAFIVLMFVFAFRMCQRVIAGS